MEQLFVYGTLKEPAVQKKVFGREVKGVVDILESYTISKIRIGNESYLNLVKKTGFSINGFVIPVTLKELKLIDDYETEVYQRKRVILKSGKEAWVYMKPRNVKLY